MQTFLPYADFQRTAKVLDDVRLGNQCYRECLVIYRNKWPHHPATKIWQGFQSALAEYALCLAQSMYSRARFKPETAERWEDFWYQNIIPPVIYPPWLGNKDFHAAHRSNLLRKDPDYYGQFGWTEPNNLPYIWPV